LNLLNLIIEKSNDVSLKEELKNIHPKQLICNEDIAFDIYKINYEYDTLRGNHRDDATKIMLKQKPINKNKKQITDNSMKLYQENIVKQEFIDTIKKFNNDNPKRALLNVKILGVVHLGDSLII
jgi:hypothetical protein